MSGCPWFILLTLSLIGNIDHASSDPCFFWDDGVGAAYTNNKCYKMFTLSGSENIQKDPCIERDEGRLAEPITDDEVVAVIRTLELNGKNNGFIGLRSLDPEGIETKWNSEVTEEDTPISVCLFHPKKLKISCKWETSDEDYICEKDVDDPCDGFLDGASYVNGTCLHVSNETVEWEEAQKSCQAIGAILAEPHQGTDQTDWIGEQANNGDLWLGAVQLASDEGTASVKWQYTGKPPPDLSLTLDRNEPAPVVIDEGGSYTVEYNRRRLQYVCEKELFNPCDGILQGSIFSSGFCFKLFTESKTWYESKVHCQQIGGQLFEPGTTQQEKIVELLLRYMYKSNGRNATWSGRFQYYYGNQQRRLPSFICQKDAHLTPKRFVVPLLKNEGQKARLQVVSPYSKTRVYIRIATYVNGEQEEMLLTSVPLDEGHHVDHSVKDISELDFGLVEVDASLPVTVQLYLYDGVQPGNHEFTTILPIMNWEQEEKLELEIPDSRLQGIGDISP